MNSGMAVSASLKLWIVSAARATDPEWVFRTEVLCQRVTRRSPAVIPAGLWASRVAANTIDGPVSLFVDVTLDRSESVIAVCGDAAGTPRTQVDTGYGIVPDVAKLHARLRLGRVAPVPDPARNRLRMNRQCALPYVSTSRDPQAAVMIDVRKDVLAATGGKQVPWDHSALTGDFYFHLASAPGMVPKVAPQAPDTAGLQQRLRQLEEELKKKSDPETTQKMVNLAQWLNQEAITFCDLVPTAFRQIVNGSSNEQRFPHLRVLYLGGERVDPQDVAAYKRSLEPTAILVTGFAATETCSEVCLMLIDKATELTENVVPLGYALPSMTIYLLDEAAQVVGSNQIGEIAVKSPYLALGYWQRPELTQARFLPDASDRQQRIYLTGDLGLLRDDGALIHKGRKDFQLKIRGNRVDIGEIEATLLALSWVKQAVVTSILYESGECALIAYLVPQQAKPTVAQIRKALAERLPSYMIPAKFVFLTALPLTVTGKIDRTALPEAQDARPDLGVAYVAPRTPLEATLVGIWEELLAITPIGVNDPFLDLGGNSLRAMQVHARLVNHWPIDFPLRMFFACATIAELALWITQQQAAQLPPEELAQLLTTLEVVA